MSQERNRALRQQLHADSPNQIWVSKVLYIEKAQNHFKTRILDKKTLPKPNNDISLSRLGRVIPIIGPYITELYFLLAW